MSPPPQVLPSRDRAEEDAFIAAWRDADETDGLGMLVEAAIEARRPMLAARLVGLLPETDGEDPGVQRARRAARLLLQRGLGEDPVLVEEFLLEWRRSRRVFMDRVRRRHRARAGQKRPRQPRRR